MSFHHLKPLHAILLLVSRSEAVLQPWLQRFVTDNLYRYASVAVKWQIVTQSGAAFTQTVLLLAVTGHTGARLPFLDSKKLCDQIVASDLKKK